MITVGVVKGYEKAVNRDGDNTVLMLKCAINAPDDIQYVQYFSQPGDNSIPPVDSQVLIVSEGGSWKIGLAISDLLDYSTTVGAGERELYSYDTTTDPIEKKAFVALRSSGELELNGADDCAVAFNELKTAFDNLVSAINSHTNDGKPIDSPISVSVDAAKVETVRLP